MEDKETLYARYLSGELSETEWQDLKKAGDTQSLDKIQELTSSLQIPALDSKAAYATFKQNTQKSKSSKTRIRRLSTWSVAASIALLCTVYFLWPQTESITADLGTTRPFTLPDGSSVVLNDGSKLTFSPRAYEKGRAVELLGEALFEVRSGASFIVQSTNGSVEVLGTRFNVRDWSKGFEVTCFEGLVRVKAGNDTVRLSAGESVLLQANGQLSTVQETNELQTDWQTGKSQFQNIPVSQVFEEMARQYAVQLELVYPEEKNFSGVFSHNDLEEALRAVCLPLGLNYTLSDNQKSFRIFVD